ncbi:MAG: DUF418 domain-containing protein [Planctomycetota bacterium]
MTATGKQPRIVGFDVARALAIFAMAYVNFEVVLALGETQPAALRTLASAFEGNASAMFVTLAGIGLVLLQARATILKRALLLLVVGYAWQVLWPGDILHYYAFYLAIGAFCLQLRVRWLWVLAAGSVGVSLLLHLWLDYAAGWRWSDLSYPAFWTWRGQVRNLVFNGWHPLFPWLAFLFAGMALGRWGIAAPGKRRLAMGAAAVVYVVAALTSRAVTGETNELTLELWGTSSIPPGPFYVLTAGSASIFWIALCLELTAIPLVARLSGPLAKCGQLALTCYLAHVFFMFIVVEPLGEALDYQGLELAFGGAVVFAVTAILFAAAWRAKFRRGPLEWVMRKLCG